MKQYSLEFVRRGLIACGFGPMVLAIVYLVLQHHGVETLGITQVCTGIVSLTALAFVAGGMNVLYQVERLPLMAAILIHGGVLYLGYLATYVLNGWLKEGMVSFLVFTGIFVVGYLVIWAMIYSLTRRSTRKVNALLREKQENS